MNHNSKELGSRTSNEFFERIVEFLKESNAHCKILNIDYGLPTLQKREHGYFGAFLESQERALKHEPISIGDLCRWQAMMVEEQLQFGHTSTKQAMGKMRSSEVPINIKVEGYVPPDFTKVPALLEKIVNCLNKKLQEIGNSGDEVALATLSGDILQKFEQLHPFVEANGRTGLLIANYIVTWFGFPIVVFRLSEKAEFYAAHLDAKSMRIYMAKKLQEAVFSDEGKIFTFCENYGPTSSYGDLNDPKAEKLLIEWHSLTKAMDQWREELKESQANHT